MTDLSEAARPTDLEAAFWRALDGGRLDFQSCNACGKNWLPPREECPACLGDTWSWRTAAGTGRLISWTIYHVAYRPELAERLPYNVAIVELDEGPRLVTNILNPDDHGGLEIEKRVELAITRPDDTTLATFRLVASST